MESILFSLNTVAPLFILGAAGYLMVQKNIVKESFFDQLSFLCFKFFIPCMLFREVFESQLLETFDVSVVGFCMLCVFINQVLAFLIWPLFLKDPRRCGAAIHSTFRTNFVLLGIPVLTNMYGSEGTVVAASVMPFVVIMFNIGAVLSFTIFHPDPDGKIHIHPLRIARSIITNPFIIAILMGIVGQLVSLQLPYFVDKSIGYFADMASPLALMAVGGQFDFEKAKGNIRLSSLISFLRIVLVPAVFTVTAAFLGYRGPALATMFILFGSPTAVSGAALAKSMDSDAQLTGEVTLITTFFSSITFFVGIFLLKQFALI